MKPPTVIFRAACALLLACCMQASALATPALPIDAHHTSWTAKDGAPPYIIAMTQTPDGWLWLAASSGLYRFDGVTFERFEGKGERFRSNNLWGMRLLESGALWIGYRYGGASVWQNGKVRNYGQEDGLPPSSSVDFEEDAAGRLWLATARGLWLFDGKRWAKAGPRFKAPETMCTLLRDRQRNLWAQCESGAYELAAGASGFAKLAGPAGIGRLTQGPDGTVWSVGGPKADVTALAGPGVGRPLPGWPAPRYAGGTMMFERDGLHLWVVGDSGVVRVGPEGASASFGMAQGLSGAVPNFILQDREGNVWVGTENGLDRFRPQLLSGVALPQVHGDSAAIASAPNGGLWVGKTLLAAPQRAAFATLPPESESDLDEVTVLWRETPDSLWTATRSGLWHEQGGKRERLPLPDNPPPRLNIYSIARDRDGDVWIAVRSRGVYQLHDGAWLRPAGVPEPTLANLLYRDDGGRMWLGLGTKGVAVLDQGKLRLFGETDGLQVGVPLQMLQVGKDMLVSGENGLFRFDGAKFRRVTGVGGDGLYGVSGMFHARGTLWMNGIAGITAIDGAELERAARDPGYRVRFQRLDHKDGLRGVATQSAPLPSAVAGSDARLWFATTAGVFWLDPAQTHKNTLPPPVLIRRITSGGVVYPLDDGAVARLPPHPSRVQIDYTALSLTMPERMRFRYRLDGVDGDWQEAGTSRSTTYTDLPPGEYRFKVQAANNDGVWSGGETAAQFVVEPAPYQTEWFRALCVTLFGMVLWGLYKLRLAQVDRQIRARFEERLDERERISRELHDTFLQTVQGLILKIHMAFQRLPADEPAKEEMERSLQLAEQALAEGRDRVQGLRLSTLRQPELVAAVSVAVRGEYGEGTMLVTQCGGKALRFHPVVFEELFAIAREALLNAARHAGATEVTFGVAYGKDDFTMTVCDNGHGIAAEVQQAGHLSGHFGMIGMRERAARIGATLTLTSGAGGTQWHLVLPATLAYAAD
jgi:signal transduction histidine kinase/ligand-binding sensor domain-containing protein